jgi:TonB-dependent starch-binding outer membrane protein SusC
MLIPARNNILVNINLKHYKIMKKNLPLHSYFPKEVQKTFLIMKISLLILTLTVIQVSASVYSQNTSLSLAGENQSIRSVFKEIENKTSYRFFYNDEFGDLSKSVSFDVEDRLLGDLLDIVLENSNVTYRILDNNVVVITPHGLLQPQVRGQVTDANTKEPLPGVNVYVKGTTTGTVTDLDGNFTINVPDDQTVLVFSYIGFHTEELIVGDQTNVNIELVPDFARLDEVVVVGYGSVRKSDLTSAISSVSMSDLPPTASLSVNNMLQGRVPGVEITPINGMPGSGVSVKIRGVSTMNNSEPLYVIDGVHIRNSLGTNSNIFSMINPNDIERIEILKDAASTAIYGAGGANGVILVTTKKGSAGAPRINFRTSFGSSSIPKKLDLLNANEYVDLLFEQQAVAYPESPLSEVIGPVLYNQQYSRVDRTDWQDQVFQDATTYQANLDVSGGTEYANYMFSLGYADQEAIVRGADYSRYTMRLATDFQVGSRVKLGQNFNLSYADFVDAAGGGRDLMVNALRMAPYVPVTNSENWWGYGNNSNVNDNNNSTNPASTVHYRSNQNRNFIFFGNVFAQIDILNSLSYYATVSMNYSNNYRDNFVREHVNGNLQLPQAYDEIYSWGLWPKFEQTLTFAESFDQHNITLLGGMSADRYGYGKSIELNATEFPNDLLNNITLASNIGINNENISVGTSLSYFGRLNYAFADKYLLTAIIRRDGSDRFASETRWGTFPSVSAAWKLHEENLFRNNLQSVSQLKLRAGWGKVGIDAIPSFLYNSFIHSVGMLYPTGTDGWMRGSTIRALASPDIKWEESTTTNIGLDISMFNNKLTLTADYFTKETSDILVGIPTSPSMGLGLSGGSSGGNRISNAATAINKGVELLLGYMNYEGTFKYGISGNFTYVNNEVTGLGLSKEPLIGPSYHGQAGITRTDIGHPIGSYYGYVADGIYKSQAEIDADNAIAQAATGGAREFYQSGATKPGDIRFSDLDGNGYVDMEDRTYIGSPIPKYTYGFAFDAQFRNWDFSANLSGIAGVEIYSALYTWELLGMRLTSNHLVDVNNRWTADNPNATLPRAVANDPNNNLRTSDRYIHNGSFLKLRNVAIGYRLPARYASRVNLGSARIYGTLQNWFTISDYIGYDPEVSSYNESSSGYNLGRGIDRGNIPNPRTFMVGIEVGF